MLWEKTTLVNVAQVIAIILIQGDCLTNEFSMKKIPHLDSQESSEKNRYKLISDVACGFQHSIIINEDKEAYGCGKADSYQIQPYKYHFQSNLTTHDKLEVPTLIWNKNKIVKAACGFKHTILLTEDNKILVVGNNKFGQRGVNYNEKQEIHKVT